VTELSGRGDELSTGTVTATPIMGSGEGLSESRSSHGSKEGVTEGAFELVDEFLEWSKDGLAFGSLGNGLSYSHSSNVACETENADIGILA
jgi:hypothetical protein